MFTVNEDLTRKIAHLARLHLTEDEVKTFTSQLREIINYIELLEEVNVSGVKPLTHPFELETPMREDKISHYPKTNEGKSKILDSAPEILYDSFKVPSIISGE
ncbi:MAG: Asp-tRNA(Asn)/Glu-tRNA(Gln) amidotransferase subunit GatC [Bdellovibrio sp.]|nr:Asp-tRNA(Asn)/Glu-tRNA(Gln) amidotransferase subunit GatC [Bdellovibrio sp.]